MRQNDIIIQEKTRYDYTRLKVLCDRVVTLPQLPTSVLRLIEVLDAEETSAAHVERIVISDPMLCMRLVRLASSQMNTGEKLTSVRAAILRLGHKAVRSLAISLGMQAMFTNRSSESIFSPIEFSRHSILVGLFARYVFARRQMFDPVTPCWSNEEVFAAGVLHDMPIAILAWVAPSAYNRVHVYAKDQLITFEDAFNDIFEGSLRDLGRRAVHTWGLPEFFALTTEYVSDPESAPKDQVPIMAIHYASAVADSNIAISNGDGAAPWSSPLEISPAIEHAVGLAPEERDMAFTALLGQLDQYLPEQLTAPKQAAITNGFRTGTRG